MDSPVAVALIRALDTELSGRYPGVNPAIHFRLDKEEVTPPNGVFLVAYGDKVAVGCGAVRLLAPDRAEIKRMYVVPEARNARVGAALLEELERAAKSLGASTIVLETGARQPEAIALYSRAGYVLTDAFGEYGEHPLAVFMTKGIS